MSSPSQRIFLWGNPRTVTTAFEKMMSHVDGCQLVHEPYVTPYFHSLLSDPDVVARFPRLKFMTQQFQQIATVIEEKGEEHEYYNSTLGPFSDFQNHNQVKKLLENTEELPNGKTFLFVKDHGICVDRHYDAIPTKTKWRHTFLIRNPRRLAPSAKAFLKNFFQYGNDDFDMTKGMPFLSWDNLSVDPLYQLYKHIKQSGLEPRPLIIDADDLCNYPKEILSQYFQALGLQFKDEYLKWDASLKFIKESIGCKDLIVWGLEQKAYGRAFYSSEFEPAKEPPKPWKDLPKDQMIYASEFEDGYRIMYEDRIRPNMG